MKTISILFSGRGSNAESIVSLIHSKKLNFYIKKIICNNKNASGIEKIKKYGYEIEIIDSNLIDDTINYNNILKEKLLPKSSEYLLLCGYMMIIPSKLIQLFNGNIINIHPSLLPKYKGLNTHEKVITNKDKYHGCTTHFVNNALDCGPMIAQSKIEVDSSDNKESVAKKLLPKEHQLFYKTLEMIENEEIKLVDNKVYYKNKILTSPLNFN